MQMEGIQGFGGWRWIFIIEGVVCSSQIPVLITTKYADAFKQITCLVAFLGYIFLISFPDNKKFRTIIPFLSVEERQLIVARVNQDRSDADYEKFSLKKWLGGGTDWKIWAYGLCKQAPLHFLAQPPRTPSTAPNESPRTSKPSVISNPH